MAHSPLSRADRPGEEELQAHPSYLSSGIGSGRRHRGVHEGGVYVLLEPDDPLGAHLQECVVDRDVDGPGGGRAEPEHYAAVAIGDVQLVVGGPSLPVGRQEGASPVPTWSPCDRARR